MCGLKIKFEHYRVLVYESRRGRPSPRYLHRYYRGKGFVNNGRVIRLSWAPLPRGGHTTCKILDEHNNILAVGSATCSYSDNFSYKVGRELALQRAEEQLYERDEA